MDKAYHLFEPSVISSCAVFSSPHSGNDYPQSFLQTARLGEQTIRSSEDAFVDRLFDAAPTYGAPFLAARFPRAYVDLNRAEEELDAALITGATRRGSNPRIAAGLGVIPRVVSEGKAIRNGKITLDEARARLTEAYHPYHDKLHTLLRTQKARFGMAVLFDCHSMPHDALSSAPLVRGKRPNIILGDRFGSSCGRWLMDAASRIFVGAGFAVARNAPFAGGYITQHYGRPSQNIHALQIEIDRGLYMDETQIAPNENFEAFRGRLGVAISELSRLGAGSLPLAAE